VKHAQQRGVWVVTQHLFWDQDKPWNTVIELAGRRFSVVFLGLRANAEFLHKFHVSLHAPHAALLMVTSKYSP
jgi:hypothetical protein